MNRVTIVFIFFIISSNSFAQTTVYNQEDGYVANGYDVVAYFQKGPKKGNSKFSDTYDGARFRFSSEENLKLFKENPQKYTPQYGGWCAYAIGANNEKVTIDPETYEIRKGKLYLFYNSFFNNTHTTWVKEGADGLIQKGDKNWVKLKTKE